MNRTIVASLLLLATLAGGAHASTILVPGGPEWVLASSSEGRSCCGRLEAMPGGGFLVVWQAIPPGSTDDDTEIRARVFDREDAPVGASFQVNVYDTGRQTDPHAAVADDGSFVVVWASEGSTGSDTYASIQARRFATPGVPIGRDLQVNQQTALYQVAPGLARAGDGTYLVDWQDRSVYPWDDDVRARRLSADGDLIGSEVSVPLTPPEQRTDRVPLTLTAAPDGRVLAAWDVRRGFDQEVTGIKGRWYEPGAGFVGPDLDLAKPSGTSRDVGAVSFRDDGSFWLSWVDRRSGGAWVRHFDVAGAPLTDSIVVEPGWVLERPAVHWFANGQFVVVDENDDDSPTDDSWSYLAARLFAEDGTPLGRIFQVNSYTTGPQYAPELLPRADGSVLAVWTRRVSAPWPSPAPPTQELAARRIELRDPFFTAGFESGDTSEWTFDWP